MADDKSSAINHILQQTAMIDIKQLESLASLELIAKQVVEGFITGLHKSPFHGFSVEFAEHRLYNNGESTKNIDWKLYARTDKLFVKRFEEETNLRCHILLDTSSSMYYPLKEKAAFPDLNKISFSVYAAAALMHLLTKQRDAVAFAAFSDKIECNTPVKSSPSHLKYLFGLLENYLDLEKGKEKKNTNIAETLHLLAEQIHKRSLIVLFSDMFDNISDSADLFYALQHLKHKKNEIILFHVVDKTTELEFDFAQRPYKFVDMESNKELKLNPAEVRADYIKKIHDFKADLMTKCSQYHIDFVEADINEGFYNVLHAYLIKREKMY